MHILKNFISIEDLEIRWGLNKKQIESFTYNKDNEPRLTMWYAIETRPRPDGEQSAFVKYAQYLNGCIFDMNEVLEIEKLNPELIQIKQNECAITPKMIGDKFVFMEYQLIKKEDLYKRWVGATHEEIAKHFEEGEIRAYEYYKGPINNIIWCTSGHIYYQERHDYSNSGLYEYDDEQCSYFLLADVVRCEANHPEYIGNITPESLGLLQGGMPENIKTPLPHAGLATLSADEIINLLRITPIELVDILNGYGTNIGSDFKIKRLVTTDEEEFREYVNNGLSEKFFNIKSLDNVKIYKRDFDIYCETWEIKTYTQLDTTNTYSSEFSSSETQGKLEKKLQAEIEKKNVRIAELEKELATTGVAPTTTVNAAKWESSVTAAFEAWAKIIQDNKDDWKEPEFRALIADLCPDYHTEVLSIAWRLLPGSFKHGRGRPKKKTEKS